MVLAVPVVFVRIAGAGDASSSEVLCDSVGFVKFMENVISVAV